MNTDTGFDDEFETAGPPGAPEAPFPWPPAEGESIARAVADTWAGASLRPRTFFGSMPEHGTIRTALLYYLPLGILASGATLFWALLAGRGEEEQEQVLGEVGLGGPMHPLVEFLLSPVLLLVSLFIAAGVVHLLLRMFGGAHRRFGLTARVFAFAYSPQLLGVIPVVGAIVGFIWMVVVAIVGLREGHGTTTARAAAAVLIPVCIGLVFLGIAALVAASGELLLP